MLYNSPSTSLAVFSVFFAQLFEAIAEESPATSFDFFSFFPDVNDDKEELVEVDDVGDG